MIGMIIKRLAFVTVISGASHIHGWERGFSDGWEKCAEHYGINKRDSNINFMNDYETFREGIGA